MSGGQEINLDNNNHIVEDNPTVEAITPEV